MPSFKLSDRFGFAADVQAGPGALSRYFKNLPDWAVAAINLKQLKDLTWDDPEVLTASGDLTFDSPVRLASQTANLVIDAALAGKLTLFVPSTDDDPLFNPDPFASPIPVPLDVRYVTASLNASLATSINTPVDNLFFGFDGKTGIKLTYSQPFHLNPVTPVVLDSLKQTLSEFAIPADLHDIANMPEGSIASAESSGDLKFSGSVNLLTLANPLASVAVPILGEVAVNATGTLTVGASFHYGGEYQVRVERLANSRFRLGIYRKRQTDFTLTATANAGIATSLDSNPVFNALLNAVSKRPQVDQNELAAAGLPQATIDAVQAALKSALDRTLTVGLTAELHSASAHDAMFLYEVDLNALRTDLPSTALIESALHGDLSPLVALDHNLPSGITILKSLITTTKTLEHRLKINLLGIYNVLTMAALIRKGAAAFDAESGEYTLTDSVTAKSLSLSTGTGQLRTVLAESLLFTAAYRAGSLVSGPPSLEASQTYFNLTARTNREQLLAGLSIAAGLGFSPAAPSALPASLGRTTLLAEASYDDPAFLALFFDTDAQLRPQAYYDRAGRSAVGFLTTDPGRLRPVHDDALWAHMRDIGNTSAAQFRQLFPGLADQTITDIGVDYLNIVWWSDAMLDTGRRLQAIRALLASDTSRTDPEFMRLKKDLADALSKLATRTRKDFGGPWGLLAMSLAAPRAGRRFLLSNPVLSLDLATPLPVAVPATKGATP